MPCVLASYGQQGCNHEQEGVACACSSVGNSNTGSGGIFCRADLEGGNTLQASNLDGLSNV